MQTVQARALRQDCKIRGNVTAAALSKNPGDRGAAGSGTSMAKLCSPGAFWCVGVYEPKAGISNNACVGTSGRSIGRIMRMH